MRLLEAKELAEENPEESLRILNDILDDDPDSSESEMALFMAAYIMMNAGKTGLAYHMYQRCAQMRPDRSEIYSNMGMCVENSNPEKAIELFEKSYRLNNKNTHAIANKALLYLHTGQPKKCISLCEQALGMDPNMRSAKHNKGLAKLMLRDWSGWDEYYQTLGVKNREAKNYGVPNWEGQEGTVLVYGEQGVGDEIMFATCLEDLAKTNRIVFDCDKRLESIFKRSLPYSVYGQRFKDTLEIEPGDEFDYQIAIGQLPYFFRKKDEDYPGKPFLTPDPERVKMWDSIMGDGPRIGFSMMGGGKETREKQRTTTLDTFEPLFGENLICLDYKKVDEDELKEKGIKYWSRGVRKGSDLEDLLAIIANLDRVVTVCTTVVYFAGALGVPCDVLVPDWAGYRYHTHGDTFPWFKSVRLHRGNFKKSVRGISEDLHRIRSEGDSGLSRTSELDNALFIGAM